MSRFFDLEDVSKAVVAAADGKGRALAMLSKKCSGTQLQDGLSYAHGNIVGALAFIAGVKEHRREMSIAVAEAKKRMAKKGQPGVNHD